MASSAREAILGRVRTALGDQREAIAAIGGHPRPRVDGDLVARFRERAVGLSSTVANVSRMADVPAAVAHYLRGQNQPLRAVCWRELRMLNWAQAGVLVEERAANGDDAVGITGTFCAIAETGTLMTLSGEHTPPVTSLLPATHIAVVRESQIVPAMEEAWQLLRSTFGPRQFMPRAVNFISGPSRTADIEQTLTFGAHGPYRVHIILVAQSAEG
jgi:L-lactate dehydrogenase complex protein LldG